MLYVYFSNNLNYLLEILADKIKNSNTNNILKPVTLIVQTEGMQKWISLNIAKKNNIFANFKFYTPGDFIFNLLHENYYKKEFLFILIAYLLDRKIFTQSEISDYLNSGNYYSKLAQISYQLADIFEQYIVFRQPMISSWERGKNYYNNDLEKWQKNLYFELKKIIKDIPYSLKFNDIFLNNTEKLNQYSPVHIFGISVLPPIFVEFFKNLGNLIDINFYLLNPCKEFWFYDISEKKLLKKLDYKSLYFEEGNPLLANLGTLGKAFFSFFMDTDIDEKYFDNNKKRCLDILKQDILERRETLKKIKISDYESIQIHICHSPLREIEVLYDNIQIFFEQDKSLTPEDILVMAPNIDIYEPYIKNIFKDIPFNISDTNPVESSQFIKIFFKILELNRTKFEVSDVLNILEFDSIKKKFNLNESDIDFIREIIFTSKIKWGIDKEFKKSFFEIEGDFLDFNTWEYGFKRILYGFMMNDENIVNKTIPISEIDSSTTKIIGSLMEFFYTLIEFYKLTLEDRKLSEWSTIIENFIDKIFKIDPEYEIYYRKIINALSYLSQLTDISSDFKVKIDFVIEFLKRKLSDSISSHKFLSGGITFAEMIPMRSIPFKIIYLIGMNDDTFPRQKKQLNFDLMYHFPELGDRNLRDNDKYLFLETLISAKDKLYISYTGYNIKDNKVLPPSILVSEIIDYLDRRIEINGKTPSEVLIFKHKLHPFNPEYFYKDSSLFSYSSDNYNAAKACMYNPKVIISENSIKLEEIKDIDSIIYLEDLWSFYMNPVSYFFTKVIDAKLPDIYEEYSDFEPVVLTELDRYKLREEIFNELIKGKAESELIENIKYRGILPYNSPGEVFLKEIKKEAKTLKEKILKKFDLENSEKIVIDFKFNNYSIEGEIENFNFYKNEYYYFRASTLNPKDYVKAIINHIILTVQLEENIKTYIIGMENNIVEIKDIQTQFLSTLIEIFLKSFKELIKFYPVFSYKTAGENKIFVPNMYDIERYGDKYLKFILNKGFVFFDEDFKLYSDKIFLPIKKIIKDKKNQLSF